jgi:hypothetical protein
MRLRTKILYKNICAQSYFLNDLMLIYLIPKYVTFLSSVKEFNHWVVILPDFLHQLVQKNKGPVKALIL